MNKTLKKTSLVNAVTIGISILFLVFQLYVAIKGTLSYIIVVPLHLCFALALVYLYNPIDKKNSKLKCLRFIDFIMFAIILFVAYYFVSEGPRLENRMAFLDPVTKLDMVVCFLVLFVLLEATRRTLGLFFLIFIGLGIAYLWLGKYLPRGTSLRHSGTNLKKFVEMMTMSTSGIFGTPCTTSASYLFYFMIFGALFSSCGGGQLLIEIGLKFGKGVGGPAKAAVVSSGLMGMISGAAVANVSTTGCMTIPMMKKTGYSPEQAGAIEAVASTGGQIMPPVMGIAAFVMAEMLGVEYKTICGAAAIPAIAYYLAIFLVVDFIARQTRQGKMSKGFEVGRVLPRLYLLLPAGVLIYMIISGYSLMRSALIASACILVINVVNPNRCEWKKVFEAVIRGCKQAAGIAIPTAASGIVIACVINSGLANKLASLMMKLGGNFLFASLFIAMIGCIIFGMALPTVAAYLLSSILFCPALIELGVSRLAANMFVFYFGIFAQITPPVCLASFTAAGISGGNPWKTGWTALRWSLVAFLTAYSFVYNPALLLEGSFLEIIQATAYLFIGTFFMAAGFEHFVGKTVSSLFLRVLLVVSGALIILPETITSVIGFAVGIAIVLYQNLSFKDDSSMPEEGKAYNKLSKVLLCVVAFAGCLAVIPGGATTIAGLCVAIAVVVYSKLRKKPSCLVEVVSESDMVEGEFIQQELDKEDDDITL